MSEIWSCPECNAQNDSGKRACEFCDAKRPGSRRAKSREPETDLQCGWITDGRRCLVEIDDWPGTSGPPKKGKPYYCWWHKQCLTLETARFADDYQAWETFWHERRGPTASPPYCDEWAHFPPEYHWEFLQGRAPAFRLPDPCHVSNCPHRPPPAELLRLSPAEHLARIKALLKGAPMTQYVRL